MTTWKNALEQAFRVNMTLPPCPFTTESAQRYPNMDLYGKHSIIDTAFSYRAALIGIASQTQPPQVSLEASRLLAAARPQKYAMEQAAAMLQTADLAAILFDMSGSTQYREMKNRLLELPVLKEYHRSLSAAEHMVGLKSTEITPYLRDYCRDVLGHPFSITAYRSRNPISPQAAEMQLPAPSPKHSALCARYTNPTVLKGTMQKEKSGPVL